MLTDDMLVKASTRSDLSGGESRHKDTARNAILNRALMDLDDIINGHDPEIDTSINNGVWDRLDKMALEIEEHAARTTTEKN